MKTNYECPTCKETIFAKIGSIVLDGNGRADSFEEAGFRCEKCRTIVMIDANFEISVSKVGVDVPETAQPIGRKIYSSVSAAERGRGTSRNGF